MSADQPQMPVETGTCLNCNAPIRRGRYCMATDCQRTRYNAYMAAKHGPLRPRTCVNCGAPVRSSRTNNTPRYCYDCRVDRARDRRHAANARPARQGLPPTGQMVYNEDGEPQCHVCGRHYRSVAIHALRTHGITPAEYRTDYELNRTQPLIAQDLSARLAQLAADGGTLNRHRYRAKPTRNPKRLQAKLDMQARTVSAPPPLTP